MIAMHDIALAVAAERHHHALTDRHRVRAHGERLATSAPERMPPRSPAAPCRACSDRRARPPPGAAPQESYADVLDEHGLRGGGAALHAVHHDHVRAAATASFTSLNTRGGTTFT